MNRKIKEKYEKTRNIKNNDAQSSIDPDLWSDKSKKYILKGQRNTNYYDKILSKNTQKNNFTPNK